MELTPSEFAKRYRKQYIEDVCRKAGTDYSYWKHIVSRRQRPSVDLANRLIEASNGELSFEALRFDKSELRPLGSPRLSHNAEITPSA